MEEELKQLFKEAGELYNSLGVKFYELQNSVKKLDKSHSLSELSAIKSTEDKNGK
jgi:hypothetical protein